MPSPLPPDLTPPRQATERNYSRATYGGHLAAVSASIGMPLIPWQRYVADVALEVDAQGVFVYSSVLLTGPRQIGKTAFDLARSIQNCLMGSGRRAWYTAQSGQHADAKWREQAESFMENKHNPLRPLLAKNPRYSNGSMEMSFVNGSKFRPHPPTEDSLHSKQSDSNSIDEAWAFSYQQGSALLGAVAPTTTTRRMVTGQRTQLWIESTEGTIESTFLNPRLEAARAGDPSVAFFDWGIGPDDDPSDLELVAAKHPGFGRLLDMQTLRDRFSDLGAGEFARAYGNRRTGSTERVIPAEPWQRAALPADEEIADGPVCFGAAVGMDGVDVSIVMVTVVAGHYIAAIVKDGHAPGTAWALDRIKTLSEKYKAPFAIDNVGPSAALYDAVKRAKVPLVELNSAAVAASCQTVLAGVTADAGPSWRYRPHVALDDAAELATRRWFSDGAWSWGRRASIGSISALEAATYATWGVDHLPEVAGFQLF